jgi:LCP family protein required for cell wall assembly
MEPSLVKKNPQRSEAVASIDGGFTRSEGFWPRKTNQTPDGKRLGRRPLKVSSIDMTIDEEKISKKRFGKAKKSKKKIIIGIVVVLLLCMGVAGYWVWNKANSIFQGGGNSAIINGEIDPSKLKGEGDGRINILLLGKGGAGHDGADLTDTILIASVDPVNDKAGLLSIPRDLYVKAPGVGSTKINAVYALSKQAALNKGKSQKEAEEAGINAIESMVQTVTGISMHYHAMIDFAGFEKAIDTVGGITVNVKEPLYDATMAWENNGSALLAPAGEQVMNGRKALMFARSRHGSARGDFDRSERQRLIIVALKDKILSAGTYSNPVRISRLISDFGNHIGTNLSIDEIMKLYNIGQKIDGNKTVSLGLVDPPHDYLTTDNINGLSVVVPKAGLNNYAAIQAFVRSNLKDGFIEKENPSIVVYNGTASPGLAKEKADILKSYGYNVTSVQDYQDTSIQQTVLIDLKKKDTKYTKRYLELRYKTSATTRIPDGLSVPENADFVIIIGQNEATQL